MTALAAALSLSAVAFAAPGEGRLAVLPFSASTILLTSGAAAAVLLLARAGASLRPLTLLGLAVLPWLPFPVPAAFLVWTGPAMLLVWTAVLVLMAASIRARLPVPRGLRRPAAAAGLAALVIFGASAWRVSPMHPGGDEPHYLVITQSLLLDGDLKIENNHVRGDYRSYFDAPLRPDYIARGRDGQIYSIHAPGISALVLPAFAAAGYPGVVVFLLVLASAGAALAWHLAWMATARRDAAWFGWAAVTLPATSIFQSFTVYPDGAGGLLTLSGLWGLLRADDERRTGAAGAWPWALHGAALALLPWLHTRFAILAAGLGSLVLLRLSTTRNPAAKAVAFLAVPAVSAVLWIGSFIAIYGRPDPSAPYGTEALGSFVWVPGGLGGLLFDQRFGLLVYAPVLAAGFAGLGLMLVRPALRRLALEILFVAVPYLVTVTHYPMWWGGWSAPARFFAPVLPLLVVPSAMAWSFIGRRAARVMALAALAFTAFASAVLVIVDRGRLAFNVRDTPALWLEWLGRGADFVGAAPSWSRTADAPLFRAIAVWLAAAALVWLALRALERAPALRRPASLATAAAWLIALAAMAAMSVMWRLERRDGRQLVSAQLHLLRAAAASTRLLAVDLERWQRIAPPNIAGRLRMEFRREASDVRGARDAPLFTVPPLPAGQYRLGVVAGEARGLVAIGIGRDQFTLRMEPVTASPSPIDLDLPVKVRGLTIRGDDEARRSVRGVILEPLSLRPAALQGGRAAHRAVRYGTTTVFFLDEGSYAEPGAFWVAGGASSALVLDPEGPRTSVRVLVRNAPVPNRLVLTSGAWKEDVQLAPAEERVFDVPVDPHRQAAAVTATTGTGFRPADVDAGSRDARFLGVWFRVE